MPRGGGLGTVGGETGVRDRETAPSQNVRRANCSERRCRTNVAHLPHMRIFSSQGWSGFPCACAAYSLAASIRFLPLRFAA